MTLAWVGLGRWRVKWEPEAVRICCSFVPANWPTIAWVTEADGWRVREYMNSDEVVAILT